MKCISLWQPWASALFLSRNGRALKPDETRCWPTAFRGRLAIHAAQRRTKAGVDYDPELDRILFELIHRRTADLPHGQLIGSLELVRCQKTINIHRHEEQLLWGDYRERGDDGKLRYAWTFTDPEPLPCPIPWKGSQGFFDVPDSLFPRPALTEFQLKP
jgi:hypothetical protein